jgi:scavenger receptor class B protein 1
MKSSRRSLQVYLCTFATSVFLIAIGLVLSLIWPVLLKFILDNLMVLTTKSYAFDLWKKFPEPFPIDFYFFNWTNPESVTNETVKPKFQEMGPYRFFETKEKANIIWNSNGTVTFRHRKFWYFDENKGINDIQDRITTVNPVALSSVYATRSWNYFLRKGLSVSLSSMAPNVYLTRTVSQMLFEGYEDPLINMARSLPFLGNSVPGWDRFGWFYTVQISSTTWTLSLSLLLYLEKRLNHIRGHLQHGHRNKFDFRQTVQLEPLDANPLLRGQLCKSERFSRGILLTS